MNDRKSRNEVVRYEVAQGDCLEVLRGWEDNTFDSVITDPPYGISFMAKNWDYGVPGVVYWAEALRVAKPGAHLLAFGSNRTHHRLMAAIEDAGWELRDTILWLYGSGFPKSRNVGKDIDRMAGAERPVIGSQRLTGNAAMPTSQKGGTYGVGVGVVPPKEIPITGPATDEARQWEGWGTNLKPAVEYVVMARKPVEGPVAKNVLQYGTGAINIDGCRVPVAEGEEGEGRWPANLIHDGSDAVIDSLPTTKGGSSSVRNNQLRPYGSERTWSTSMTPAQQTRGYTDSGSVARFFYCSKANAQDREEGLLEAGIEPAKQDDTREEGAPGGDNPRNRGARQRLNNVPTVKPVDLMRYLCRLVTPPNGIVLDPFTGSGSTGKGAILEGFDFYGIEIDGRSCEIARARLAYAVEQEREGAEQVRKQRESQPGLFDEGA